MKIVIDVPECYYSACKDWQSAHVATVAECIIAYGTPLVGHGRLIDEKEACNLIAEGKEGDKAYFGTVSKDWEVIDFLKTVPTIIEADKER